MKKEYKKPKKRYGKVKNREKNKLILMGYIFQKIYWQNLLTTNLQILLLKSGKELVSLN